MHEVEIYVYSHISAGSDGRHIGVKVPVKALIYCRLICLNDLCLGYASAGMATHLVSLLNFLFFRFVDSTLVLIFRYLLHLRRGQGHHRTGI